MDMDRIRGTAQQVGGKVREVVGRASGDRSLQAEGFVDEVAGGVRNLYGRAKDGLRDAADTAAGGRRPFRGGARPIEREIEEHPLVGLMVAGALGYLVGLLIHLRR